MTDEATVILDLQGAPGADAGVGGFLVSAPGPQPFNETWPILIGRGFIVGRVGGRALEGPTSPLAIYIYRNGVLVSTISFATGARDATTTGVGTQIADDDLITVAWPALQDPSALGICFYMAP